jgi:hypothetical protein
MLITPVRYVVLSEHIRMIQLASIHELMEKYKSSSEEAKSRQLASSGRIKINLM